MAFISFIWSIVCLTILFLYKKNFKFDFLAEDSAIIGLFYGVVAILTGSIWAKATWGLYWHWDPRETATLILELAYVGYIVLRRSIVSIEKKAFVSGIYNVLSFITVPLSYFSVKIWTSIHPIVFTPKPQLRIEFSMIQALILSLVAGTAVYIYLMRQLYMVEKLGRALEKLEAS